MGRSKQNLEPRTSLGEIWGGIRKHLTQKTPARLWIYPLVSASVVSIVVHNIFYNGALTTIIFGCVWFVLFLIEINTLEKEEMKNTKDSKDTNAKV